MLLHHVNGLLSELEHRRIAWFVLEDFLGGLQGRTESACPQLGLGAKTQGHGVVRGLPFPVIQKLPSQAVFLGEDCQVEFEFCDDLPPLRSGKFRYTISEVCV